MKRNQVMNQTDSLTMIPASYDSLSSLLLFFVRWEAVPYRLPAFYFSPCIPFGCIEVWTEPEREADAFRELCFLVQSLVALSAVALETSEGQTDKNQKQIYVFLIREVIAANSLVR